MADDQSPNKRLVRLFYDEMWNKADKARIAEIFHDDFTFRGSLGPVLVGHRQFASYVDDVVRALPDFRCDIEEMTEEAGRVVAKMRFGGTNLGPMFGRPPTGRPVAWAGSAHFHFRIGLADDLWVLGDIHGLLAQLDGGADKFT
ncbi:MAG: ester cyclase [Proteobacteria bacterium]|nr:ester cyclase [Pseudomonadota bacterium]